MDELLATAVSAPFSLSLWRLHLAHSFSHSVSGRVVALTRRRIRKGEDNDDGGESLRLLLPSGPHFSSLLANGHLQQKERESC